ncbi:uncharacterized protein DUF4348 [Mucilaginibacter gracilis]|uniref:Uncharacterized protein DUF4348 n=1 Tax=Mucilaginibacter gracilis TaxID=423350 RepID=A0A495J9N2_9SPHI|nr:DUF4348 domain-containing protein [Mucilaginibacter gracilis]RKR84769.1 uncharacterized protein DUF4348 [Mucilaginibacter gracilis]
MPKLFKTAALFGFALLITTLACVQKPQHQMVNAIPKKITEPADKNFETFYKHFERDSVFQLSRIIFPVKLTITYDDDTHTIKLIKKADWKYFNTLDSKAEKYIVQTKHLNSTQYKTIINIEDTGYDMEYRFINKGSKWWLAGIEDNGD